ncbi:MAG: efflux RND transporter periplasmic adaptor subunit [Spirochaetia bacterium]|jgi:multidrug efflux pump subunit AcrA (membrane-fusion protein)|nr:efflux RND transporter periplasmic adaptor subunit [Spirochaetia bacterium]
MVLCIITLFLLLSPFFTACRENIPEAEQPLVQIRTVEAVTEKTSPSVSGFGTVLYYSKADVFPAAEGYIEKIYFDEGDKVKKGDILAKLKQEKLLLQRREAAAAVDAKKSLLSLAEERLKAGLLETEQKIISVRSGEAYLEHKKTELSNMERIYTNKKQLFEAGGISPEELEKHKMSFINRSYEAVKAQNDLDILKCGYRDKDILAAGYLLPQETAERNELFKKINTSMLLAEKNAAVSDLNAVSAELAIIDLLIKETEIHSPISGIIGTREMDIGEKVNPETKLFSVFDSSKVYLRVEIGEIKSFEIKKGNPVSASTDYAEITGTVEMISPVINPASRSREIKILADNSSNLLIPGSFVKVNIRTGENENYTVIPETALLKDEENKNNAVFMVRNNILFKKEIDVSFIQDNKVFIRQGQGSGGSEFDYSETISGEIISLYPDTAMTDGMKVEITR